MSKRPLLTPRGGAAFFAAAVAAVLSIGAARAATYHVDVATGVDAAARDGLTPATAWRSLTYAVSRIRTAGPHEVLVAAGELTAATGEAFPVTLPHDVSLTGAGPAATIFRDATPNGAGTIRWQARTGAVPATPPTFQGFTVIREPFQGQPVGAGVELLVENVTVAPRLTNVILRGAARGLDLYSRSDATASSLAPVVDRCLFLENSIGVLGTAYTTAGQDARLDPTFTNCVANWNLGDGMVFETGSSWDLATGQRTRSTSAPIITHCTIAENLGSAILLDNSNGYLRYRAGPIGPRVTNSVLSQNGDYALHEYTTTTDPVQFDRNLIGGNLVALYRDEGTTDILTLGAMPMGAGNINSPASFMRGLQRDYHLRGDSAGVDVIATGFLPVDVDLDARPIDGNNDTVLSGDMGADEARACAINAVITPAAPPDRCGLEPAMGLSGASSGIAAGFSCGQPLTHTWYADGVEIGTGPSLSVTPTATTTYTLVVTCPAITGCRDATSVRVVVHSVPAVDAEAGDLGPTGDYEACVEWDAPDVTVAMRGTAEATEEATGMQGVEWVASDGILLGAFALNPLLTITNTGQNQDIGVSLTGTDTNGCSTIAFTRVHVWRGPRPLPGGPYQACQNVGMPTTRIPVVGDADFATGNVAATWQWRTDIGFFEDSGGSTSSLQSPRLVLTNFAFNRTANLTLTVTDDKGCTDSDVTTLTLFWTPDANANGPYQEPEAAVSPTLVALAGTFTGQPGTVLSWTTDLGTFQSTGTTSATGANQTLEIPNTGTDQLGQVCLTATPPGGTCPNVECTEVSVRTSPPQPPHDIGGTLRIDKTGVVATLRWTNPPIDATHDRAEVFDAWESALPGPGAWTPRATLEDVPRIPGGTSVTDADLLDLAGPDMLFLKIVSENAGGLSCPDPAAGLPACP